MWFFLSNNFLAKKDEATLYCEKKIKTKNWHFQKWTYSWIEFSLHSLHFRYGLWIYSWDFFDFQLVSEYEHINLQIIEWKQRQLDIFLENENFKIQIKCVHAKNRTHKHIYKKQQFFLLWFGERTVHVDKNWKTLCNWNLQLHESTVMADSTDCI